MRTFPKALADFQKMVDERGQRLRAASIDEVKNLAKQPPEQVKIELRKGTISIIAQPGPGGALKVVVQGFLKNRLLPGSSVALDGFYKHPDGSVSPLAKEEFWDYS